MIAESEKYKTTELSKVQRWEMVAKADVFPENGGSCVKLGDLQIAVFRFTKRNEWYACQNLCPHRMQMILARGIIGSEGEEPKVACPFHKQTFSLKTGKNLNGDLCDLATYPIKVKDGYVYLGFEA
jgi:nitrite reductase (NADH) small subunit